MGASVVQAIEDNARAPLLDTIEHLARALAVEPCWLAFGQLGGRTFGSGRFPSAEQGPDDPQPAPMASGPLSCAGIGKRLLMARGKMSRNALAKLADLSHTAIGNIESGTMPSVETAEMLAGALGVSPCWLAFGVGEGPSEE